MSIISVTKSHLSEMCRVCLSPVNGPFTDIFSTGRANLPSTIAAAVMECAPVHITQGDGLPAFICNSCSNNLEISHQFRNQCIRSESILQRYVNQLNNTVLNDTSTPGSTNSYTTENSSNDKDNYVEKTDELVKDTFSETFTTSFVKEECNEEQANCSSAFVGDKTVNIEIQTKNLPNEFRTINGAALKPDDNNATTFTTTTPHCEIKLKFTTDAANCFIEGADGNKFTNACFIPDQSPDSQYKFISPTVTTVDNSQINKVTVEKQYSNLSNATMTIPEQNFDSYLVKLFTKEEERPHKCNICEKTFKRSSNLSEHSKVHNECRPYKCEVCQKWFKRSCDLAEHKRTHSNERPFKCTVCSKTFKRNCDLSEHNKIHTNERPFECDICHKGFKRNGQFLEHRRIHTGERPYECETCHQHFRTSSKLSAHSKVHNEEWTHKCNICAKSFKSYKSLTIHSRVHSTD